MSVTTGTTSLYGHPLNTEDSKGLCVTLDLAEIYRVTRESPQDGNVSGETSYAREA